MLTGRFTYGLGQVDSTSVFSAFMNTPPGQSTVVQTAPAQWGTAEWLTIGVVGYIALSVFTQTKRTVGKTRGYLEERRERLAREHEAEAERYRAKSGGGGRRTRH